jgi:hypothetical protein
MFTHEVEHPPAFAQNAKGPPAKTDVAMVSESLCKILCHNLVVLIHEMFELGIEPMFWQSGSVN